MGLSVSVDDRIRALTTALADTVPGSVVVLRGSRAAGTADEFSDVDVRWQVGRSGDRALADLPSALATVGTVESLRLDPDEEPERRLVFVRFAGWSLFERVDLEVVGAFGDTTPSWVRPWSPAESALMNAIAAVKADRRGGGDVDGLLARGAARLGAPAPTGSVAERIVAVVDAAVRADPAQQELATRVRALVT
ncbi:MULTISPECIES: hypothetical protein [unclassified Curtobacterium]|uniref:hypothetical protein n=1 Tax=unclassified Curtobacterium TaxID=257496 RepID=UPI00380198BF